MVNLTSMDSKILTILLQDGRKNFVELANACDVTKNNVWKRFRSLEKKQIIVGATTQVNFTSLGYDSVATLLIKVEAQQINNIVGYIEKLKKNNACRQYNNFFNIRATAILGDFKEVEQIKETIKRKIPVELKTYIWTGIKNIPENLSILPDQKRSDINLELGRKKTVKKKKEIKIDSIDMKIIQKLTQDGRMPFSNIAKEIGISTDAIAKRYQKLADNGILKIIIQINPKKLGYNSILDFNISYTLPSNSSGIIEALMKIPDVVSIIKTSGDYDLQLTSMVRDVEQMFKLQEEIEKISGVVKVETGTRKIPAKWPPPQQHITTF